MQYLKTSCNLYSHCDGVKIDEIVSHWYGLNNTPIISNPTKVEQNIEKYKSLPIQKTSKLFIIEIPSSIVSVFPADSIQIS